MKSSYEMKRWLNSRGGRTLEDIREDENGLYIIMGSGTWWIERKMYIPTDEEIRKILPRGYGLIHSQYAARF